MPGFGAPVFKGQSTPKRSRCVAASGYVAPIVTITTRNRENINSTWLACTRIVCVVGLAVAAMPQSLGSARSNMMLSSLTTTAHGLHLPAVSALVGVLPAVAAVALRVCHNLAAPWALQHLPTGSTEILPEGAKLHHEALGGDRHAQAVFGLSLVWFHVQGATLHVHHKCYA